MESVTGDLYTGRMLVLGKTNDGKLCCVYRVSSRSFPNREITSNGEGGFQVIPKKDFLGDVLKNPYVSYNCLRVINQEIAVISNGSQTDVITEKIVSGMSIREAMAISLIALDYEKDNYDTPRIAAVIDKRNSEAWMGVVRRDGLQVQQVMPIRGRCYYIATYIENSISEKHSTMFPVNHIPTACEYVLRGDLFGRRTHPIASAGVLETAEGFRLYHCDISQSHFLKPQL